MPRRLVDITVEKVAAVDAPANRRSFLIVKRADADVEVDKAVWTTEYINSLPDDCFAVIEPGGEKDEEGKTVPRSLRHLPYKNREGQIDIPHLRNALARLPQTHISDELKEKARRKLLAAAKEVGIEVSKSDSLALWEKFVKALRDIFSGESSTTQAENTGLQSAEKHASGGESNMADQNTNGTVAKNTVELPEELKKRFEELEKKAAEAEELRKRVEEAERIAKEEREARERAEIRKRAESYANAGPVDDIADVLFKAYQAGKEYGEKLEALFRAAHERIARGELFREIGGNGSGSTQAEAKLMAKAEEIRKADPKLTKEQAFAKACEENPDLYLEYRREAR